MTWLITTDGSDLLVNSTTQGTQSSPAVAALTDGNFVVIWKDESQKRADTSGSAIRGRRLSIDGITLGGEFPVSKPKVADQINPAVAALAEGSYVVVWEDYIPAGGGRAAGFIRGRRFEGNRPGEEFLVNQTTKDLQTAASVSALASGGFVVVWEDFSKTGDDTSGSAIRGRLFNGDASAAGAEFLVNSTTASHQTRPSVAGLANGSFVVVWKDQSVSTGGVDAADLRGRLFNADGNPKGDEFPVTTTTTAQQYFPAVAALADSGFVVVWDDLSKTGDDLSSYAVRGRRFDADGNEQVPEFLVNSTTKSMQFGPSVAGLPNNRFVVVWTDQSQTGYDTSGGAVRAQRFDSDGTAAGKEFLVNTTTSDSQNWPCVAILPNSTFMVVWQDYSKKGSDVSERAIRARIFKEMPDLSPIFNSLLAAIDPMALILSGSAYLRWLEWKHPHVPKVAEIAEMIRSLRPEERAFALGRAKLLAAYGKAVEQAVAAVKE